jgi:Uma2 family endonuclease
VTVVCGEVEKDPEGVATATKPQILIEVTSPSTADFDRGEKREHYTRIPSLEAIVIVAHDQKRIEVWTRADQGWIQESRAAGTLQLRAASAVLDVDEIYSGIEL